MSVTREMIVDGIAEPPEERKSILRPYVMSHGTLECRSLRESRKFYEEFLGMECARHAIPAMVIRCGLKFHVVCVEVGDNIHPVSLLNHWGLDMESREKVDEAYALAKQHQEKYKIRQVLEPAAQHGVYSFYLEDLDHNWWEIQYIPGFQHEDMFDFGDRFPMEVAVDPSQLNELSVKISSEVN